MRIVTRGDLDGLTCAVLISLNEATESVRLIHPQQITDGAFEVQETDIIANLPYHPNCALWFDHHQFTATPIAVPTDFSGVFEQSPSCASLVYRYYGGEEKMPEFLELVRETDRLDSADLTPGDVINPQRYIKVGLTIDGRTGLGAFEDYFMRLLDLLVKKTPIESVLEDPEVARRCELMEEADRQFRDALRTHSRLEGNVIITDFRSLDEVPVGNRFLVYTLFLQANVSVRLQWGPGRKHPMLTLGHSIFNRTCKTNVGELAARYGGGGHRGAASIPLIEDLKQANQQIQMIVAELKGNG